MAVDWVRIAESLGVPAAVLLALGVAIWETGRFLRPHMDALLTNLSALIVSLRMTNERDSDSLERMTDAIGRISPKVDQIHQKICGVDAGGHEPSEEIDDDEAGLRVYEPE